MYSLWGHCFSKCFLYNLAMVYWLRMHADVSWMEILVQNIISETSFGVCQCVLNMIWKYLYAVRQNFKYSVWRCVWYMTVTAPFMCMHYEIVFNSMLICYFFYKMLPVSMQGSSEGLVHSEWRRGPYTEELV